MGNMGAVNYINKASKDGHVLRDFLYKFELRKHEEWSGFYQFLKSAVRFTEKMIFANVQGQQKRVNENKSSTRLIYCCFILSID